MNNSSAVTANHVSSTNVFTPPVLLLINPTSLNKNNAVQQLSVELITLKPDIVLITETWFTEKTPPSLYNISNYNLYRKDRLKRKGGGVAAYVNANFKCEYAHFLNNNMIYAKFYGLTVLSMIIMFSLIVVTIRLCMFMITKLLFNAYLITLMLYTRLMSVTA